MSGDCNIHQKQRPILAGMRKLLRGLWTRWLRCFYGLSLWRAVYILYCSIVVSSSKDLIWMLRTSDQPWQDYSPSDLFVSTTYSFTTKWQSQPYLTPVFKLRISCCGASLYYHADSELKWLYLNRCLLWSTNKDCWTLGQQMVWFASQSLSAQSSLNLQHSLYWWHVKWMSGRSSSIWCYWQESASSWQRLLLQLQGERSRIFCNYLWAWANCLPYYSDTIAYSHTST